MSYNDDKNKDKYLNGEEEGEGDSGSGKGGRSGQVEFKEFVAGGEKLRDDLLSPEELKRLLAVHNQNNESGVKKQKSRRDEYKALKEGKTNLQDFRKNYGGGTNAGYKTHAILANKAQFSGIDKQVNPVANEHTSDTNNDKQQELQYQYQLQNRPQYTNAPRSTPKPSPFNR